MQQAKLSEKRDQKTWEWGGDRESGSGREVCSEHNNGPKMPPSRPQVHVPGDVATGLEIAGQLTLRQEDALGYLRGLDVCPGACGVEGEGPDGAATTGGQRCHHGCDRGGRKAAGSWKRQETASPRSLRRKATGPHPDLSQ